MESLKDSINYEPKSKIEHRQYVTNKLNIDKNQMKSSQKIKIRGAGENIIKTNKEVNDTIVKTYDRESSRVQVKKSQLKHIYSELKERGFTLDKISQIIGCSFRNSLYKGYSLSRVSFNKLQDLYGLEIPHEIKEPIVKTIDLEKNENLAELIGVILGDGHLNQRGNTLSITLNFIEERKYVKHVENIVGEVLNIEPSIVELSNNKANQIRVYGKGIIDAFVNLGLKTGNKVENQVGVPNWIKNNKNFCVSCLKGLFDTDGSIYLTSDKKRIAMNFKNNSRPLVESFKEMCEKLAIKTNEVYEGWTYSRGKRFNHYKVEMFKQDQIKRFISTVYPEKWLNRKERFIEILKNNRSTWSAVFNNQ
jgi:uncharacterized protein (UPF0297 family)